MSHKPGPFLDDEGKEMREDLTVFSDDELSLHVFNTEHLYKSRNHHRFLEMLEVLFIFTPGQLKVLKQDLNDEQEG